MAENIQRSRGRSQGYKFDRGGMPAEMGPYIGIVVNNVDATRSGRLQVYIDEFGATTPDGKPKLDDPTLWRTVSYCPPFYGATPVSGTSSGYGTYPGNRNSYGMWFTPPDLGVSVLCFFVAGDPSQGYYVGCIPEQGINHMIPAIGSSTKFVLGNSSQQQLFANSPLLPVTEINELNPQVNQNPRFFDQPKPVQSVQAATYFQQGLDRDLIRGPIRSSSQRESPSSVYGISTPGQPIYAGGLDPKTIREKLERGEISPQQVNVIGRQGGHTFVLDDGDLEGNERLIRIRTAKGHQITMSDDGDSFYITHANGQTWIELGKQGTVDVYSTNSINLRTQGTLNFHADQDINMYAGGKLRIKSKNTALIESEGLIGINGQKSVALYSKSSITVGSDGNLALSSKVGTWDGGTTLNLKGSQINLNGASTLPTSQIPSITGYKLPDAEFTANQGWKSVSGKLETIVTRAPTHEPYPYHGKGVNVQTNLNNGTSSVTEVPVASTEIAPTTATVEEIQSINQSSINRAYEQSSSTVVQNTINIEDYLAEPPSSQGLGGNQ